MFFGMEIWPIDQPASFAALLPTPPQPQRSGAPAAGRGALGGGTERDEPPDYPWEPSGGRPHPGYDVLVLNDQMNWPEATRALARQAVEAGRGFVLLHHSLGDNQDWPWWYEEVTGGLLVLDNQNGKKVVYDVYCGKARRPPDRQTFHPPQRRTVHASPMRRSTRTCGSRQRLRRCSRPLTAAAIPPSRGLACIRRQEWCASSRVRLGRHTGIRPTACSSEIRFSGLPGASNAA